MTTTQKTTVPTPETAAGRRRLPELGVSYPLPAGERLTVTDECVVIHLIPRPIVRVFDATGKQTDGRECANIRDAAAALVNAHRGNNLNTPGTDAGRELKFTVDSDLYGALKWACNRARTGFGDFVDTALLEALRRVVQAEFKARRDVPPAIAQRLAVKSLEQFDPNA